MKGTGAGMRMAGRMIGVSLAAMAAAMPGQAQTPEADAAAGQATDGFDIVVTARRQAESLTDVPVTVSVITAEDIEAAGIESVADFARLVPNVTFDSALNLGQTHLTIRGISQVQGAQPPAAIVVDGVLLISPLQFNIDHIDLAQIEVLKGPQGAIYGRNAIAGAINITTRRPGDSFEGELSAGFGRGEEYRARARVSGPIVPGLLGFTAAGGWTDRQGQIRNVTTGRHTDYYEHLTGRFGLFLTPSPDVELVVRYAYSDSEGGDPTYVLNATGDVDDTSTPATSDFPGRNPREMHELSGTASWDTGIGTAHLALSFVDVDERVESDFDFTPIPAITVFQDYADRGFSQELRFTSRQDGRLRWHLGGYHVTYRHDVTTLGLADPGLFSDPPEPTGSVSFPLIDTLDRNRLENHSAFAQAEYDVTDAFELGLALRYDRDRIRLAADDGSVRRRTFSRWQPKVTARYRAAQETTLYASYGEGFRSGGFNPSAAAIGGPIFLPESAATYELGLRSAPFGRRLLLNLAAFHTDLRNAQLLVLDVLSGSNVGLNVDETRIRGFEAEATARLLPSLTLDAAFGLTDTRIGAFPEVPAYAGNDLPRVPDYTINLGLSHDREWSQSIRSILRIDYQRIGPFHWDVANTARRRAVDYLNARLTLRHEPSGAWLALWGKNLLDDRTTADYQTIADTGHPFGLDAYFPAAGATYGVEIGVRF